MGGGVDVGQLADRHAGVDLGGGQALVAQQLLDEPDVCPALQHQGRRRVAEQMAEPALAQLGGGPIGADATLTPPFCSGPLDQARGRPPHSLPPIRRQYFCRLSARALDPDANIKALEPKYKITQ